MTETSLVVAAEPWRWTIPVNQGAEVHRLADDFIVEIERSSGQVEFEVWEIRGIESEPVSGRLLYHDENYQFTHDRSQSPPDFTGKGKFDGEIFLRYPHKTRQIYGVDELDREVRLIYWLTAAFRNQYGDHEYDISEIDPANGSSQPYPKGWPLPPGWVELDSRC